MRFRLLIVGAALSALATAQTPLAFEVASVKPHVFARGEFAFGTASRESAIHISGNRVTVQGLVAGLVMAAYQLRSFQLSGAPDWQNESGRFQLYDIEALAPGNASPTLEQARQMLTTLLADRFHLKFHRETKELPAYFLTLADASERLKPSAPDVPARTVRRGRFRTEYINMPIAELVLQVGPEFDRPLLDRTGLEGGYDFSLEYLPSLPNTVGLSPDQKDALAQLYPEGEAPPLPVALQRQLGFKVVATKAQVEILVIDHVERPSAN